MWKLGVVIFKSNYMKNNYYELKQTTLMEMEIEGLVAKIQRLEKELALKEQENKSLNQQLLPFLTEQEKRKKFIENRDRIDEQLSKMLSKLHS